MSLLCPYCGSGDFQGSRLRLSDLSRLLRLQFPLRCRECMKRRFAPLSLARAFSKPARSRKPSA